MPSSPALIPLLKMASVVRLILVGTQWVLVASSMGKFPIECTFSAAQVGSQGREQGEEGG
ncbi:hypothetical protein [Olivibacter jilunii]|uniref:hypothetical protein n=1 Tax=Olivibacter jilunii TaxID=985016 RepID=UPI003F180FD0